MKKTTITLSAATQTDVEQIARLAHQIWNTHYPGIISQQQIDFMLADRYSHHKITDEIAAGIYYYIIQAEREPIGFIAIEELSDKHFFIHKFYLKKENSRGGAGTLAFSQLLERHPIAEMRLQVNRKNYQAVNFYFKMGFSIEKAEDFPIGGGYFMEDFVMVWSREKLA